MSSHSYNDLYRLFKKLDQNGDGLVSPNELQSLLDTMKVGSSVDELESLTGKTSLNFSEFLEFYSTITITEENNGHGQNESESDLFKAFEVFDRNRDGFICDEELQDVLSTLGLWDDNSGMDVKSMIKAYDANRDGFLDFQEFKKMMM